MEVTKVNETLVVQKKHITFFYAERTKQTMKMQLNFQNRLNAYSANCKNYVKEVRRHMSALTRQHKQCELMLKQMLGKVRKLKAKRDAFVKDPIKIRTGNSEMFKWYNQILSTSESWM